MSSFFPMPPSRNSDDMGMPSPLSTISPCPFCESSNVERHYARQDGGVTWPGCLSCEATMPLAEWLRLVEERK